MNIIRKSTGENRNIIINITGDNRNMIGCSVAVPPGGFVYNFSLSSFSHFKLFIYL